MAPPCRDLQRRGSSFYNTVTKVGAQRSDGEDGGGDGHAARSRRGRRRARSTSCCGGAGALTMRRPPPSSTSRHRRSTGTSGSRDELVAGHRPHPGPTAGRTGRSRARRPRDGALSRGVCTSTTGAVEAPADHVARPTERHQLAAAPRPRGRAGRRARAEQGLTGLDLAPRPLRSILLVVTGALVLALRDSGPETGTTPVDRHRPQA